jgi:hypothetical protein
MSVEIQGRHEAWKIVRTLVTKRSLAITPTGLRRVCMYLVNHEGHEASVSRPVPRHMDSCTGRLTQPRVTKSRPIWNSTTSSSFSIVHVSDVDRCSGINRVHKIYPRPGAFLAPQRAARRSPSSASVFTLRDGQEPVQHLRGYVDQPQVHWCRASGMPVGQPPELE